MANTESSFAELQAASARHEAEIAAVTRAIASLADQFKDTISHLSQTIERHAQQTNDALRLQSEQNSRQFERLRPDQKSTWVIVIAVVGVLLTVMNLSISATDANVKTTWTYAQDSRELIRENQVTLEQHRVDVAYDAGRQDADLSHLMDSEGERRRRERATSDEKSLIAQKRDDDYTLELTERLSRVEGKLAEME